MINHPSYRPSHTTILFCFNRKLNRDEVRRVREIAESHDAKLIYVGRTKETNHTGWFTFKDIGSPFTDRAAREIREGIARAGILLSDA